MIKYDKGTFIEYQIHIEYSCDRTLESYLTESEVIQRTISFVIWKELANPAGLHGGNITNLLQACILIKQSVLIRV